MSGVVRARLAAGAFLLAGAALVVWFLMQVGRDVPATLPSDAGIGGSGESRSTALAGEVPTNPATDRISLTRAIVQVLTRDNRPVRGAVVRYDGVEHVSDEAGNVSFVPTAMAHAIGVSHDGYLPEEEVELTGENTIVRLRPAITIDIQAVLDESRPLSGARFWVRPYRMPRAELMSEDSAPSAVTDEMGRARIGPFEFPAAGILFLQGMHEDRAFCKHAQEEGRSIVFRDAGRHTVTARFLTPRVIAVDLPESGVVTWKAQLLGNSLCLPENGEASWTCDRIAARIQKQFPDAVVTMALPAYPAGTAQVWDPRVTLWIAGRQPFVATCKAVPADEFVAPQRIEPPRGALHDGFGSLRAVVTDAAGKRLPDSMFRLIGDLTQDWPGDRNLLVKPKGEDTDGWMTLPTGTWRVDFYDDVLQALAKAQSAATVTLAKGGRAEARVVFDRNLVKCRYEARFDGEGPWPSAGVVRLQNAELGLDVPFLRNNAMQPFEFLLPEGENSVVVDARTTQEGPVLVGRTVITIRADSSAPQPVVQVLLAPKR